MTTWNDRLLPHPLLAYWNDDYGDAVFRLTLPHDPILNPDHRISLGVKFHLTSSYLASLIAANQAEYMLLVTCQATFDRDVIRSRFSEEVLTLDATKFSGEVVLLPFVVAVNELQSFSTTEHAEEIRNAKSDGFNIPTGAILAVGRATTFDMTAPDSPFSCVDLFPDENISRGAFAVDLNDNRIKIRVHPEEKSKLEQLRRDGERTATVPILFQALYLHAIAEGVRGLHDHMERRWAMSFTRALENMDISIADAEDLRERSLQHAQRLLKYPLGTMLIAMSDAEEE